MNDIEANKMLLQQVDSLIEQRDLFAHKYDKWKRFWAWLKDESIGQDTWDRKEKKLHALPIWLHNKFIEFTEKHQNSLLRTKKDG